jgi:hypothetical protein
MKKKKQKIKKLKAINRKQEQLILMYDVCIKFSGNFSSTDELYSFCSEVSKAVSSLKPNLGVVGVEYKYKDVNGGVNNGEQ